MCVCVCSAGSGLQPPSVPFSSSSLTEHSPQIEGSAEAWCACVCVCVCTHVCVCVGPITVKHPNRTLSKISSLTAS